MVVMMRVAFRGSVIRRCTKDPHRLVKEEEGEETREDRGLPDGRRRTRLAEHPF